MTGMRTALCDQLGIEHPIVGFTPSEHVAAAISRAGGLGVLGCVRFNDAAELDKVLDWMDASTDGRPYGIDVVMPAKIPAEGAAIDLNQLIPAGHRDFVDQTLIRLGVPPLPADAQAREGVLGWLHSVARAQVEVALAHPARLIANALGSPPPDIIASAHDRGMLVAALAGKATHARSHADAGVDIVVAQGYEAGGHTGEIASMVLVPEVVDAVGPDIPVLAAGGIGSGRQIAAALALGPLQDLQRQARQAAEEQLDRGLAGTWRTRSAAHAAAEPARRRGAPAPDAIRQPGRDPDAGRPDRWPDERSQAGRRYYRSADGRAAPGGGPAGQPALTCLASRR